MADDRVFVHSATGVDLTLNIAGPGSRGYAFVIDWHIRLLLGGAWAAGLAVSAKKRRGIAPRTFRGRVTALFTLLRQLPGARSGVDVPALARVMDGFFEDL